MRHRKAGRKLKRTASHRRATLAALSTSLLRHKRITTTIAKARETRLVVEKLITRARRAAGLQDAPATAIHARREVARMVRDRAVVKELFSTIVEKIGSRPGGYTRIVKLGQRQGDGAEMAVIELVDFNTGQEIAKTPAPAGKPKKSSSPKKDGAAGSKKKKEPAGRDTKNAGKKKEGRSSGAPEKESQ
jgi:large subunit ribosomal protein L17